MSKQASTADNGRRDFLKKLGVAGGAAAVAAAAGQASAATAPAASEATVKADGYQKSEHVKAYYATCRS